MTPGDTDMRKDTRAVAFRFPLNDTVAFNRFLEFLKIILRFSNVKVCLIQAVRSRECLDVALE